MHLGIAVEYWHFFKESTKLKTSVVFGHLSELWHLRRFKYQYFILFGIVWVLELYWNCCFGCVYCIGPKRPVLFICGLQHHRDSPITGAGLVKVSGSGSKAVRFLKDPKTIFMA